MAPSLEHVFTMRMYTSPSQALVIPEAKGSNHRIVAFLTHGSIKGSGISADLLPGGADWILVSEIILDCLKDIKLTACT